MKTKWKETSTFDKVLSIARIFVSLSIVVLALLKLLDVWDKATNITVPLMGVLLILMSVQEWKRSRGNAIFSLCAAVFIIVCSFVVWFVK